MLHKSGLFLMLKCRQMWIFSNIFETISFTRSLPNTLIQRSRTLEGGVKKPIIQIPRNFWVPYTVQFIGLFGYIWLLYEFIFSVILASSSSVKKQMSLKNWWRVQIFKIYSGDFIFSLNLKAVFKDFVPPTTLSSFGEWFSASRILIWVLHFLENLCLKVKVKVMLEWATKVQSWSRVIDLLFL